MNTIFKNLTFKQTISEVIPSLGISLMITEYFFKLGSFALECMLFLVTWYFIGNVINKIKSIINNNK